MTPRLRGGLGRLARWAVLTTTLVMVLALVLSSWANLRAVEEASETLHNNQSDALVDMLVGRARRSLALSLLAGVALLGVAGGVWRFLRQREEAERQLELQRRLQALGEMSTVLAHELRNPLASLKGHAQLLAERLDENERERRKAERIVGEASRLEVLSETLLDFCRIGSVECMRVDPVELVRQAVREAGAEPVVLDDETAPKEWPLDPIRICQALVNVLRNARQASPEGEDIEVRVLARGEDLEVVVRDRGDGIPEGCEEQIFEPFFTRRTRGTGLGLAVARRTVEMHSGHLTASNAPDGGAVFTFSIPRELKVWRGSW